MIQNKTIKVNNTFDGRPAVAKLFNPEVETEFQRVAPSFEDT